MRAERVLFGENIARKSVLNQYPTGIGMAQPIETGLLYSMTAGSSGTGQENFADTMRGLTLLNQKKFDQTKSRRPLATLATVTQIQRTYTSDGTWHPQSSFAEVHSLANNWMVRNAITKLGHTWRAQIKHAGLSLKDLPRYGREMNMWMELGHKTANTDARNLIPEGADGSDITAEDGTVYSWYPTGVQEALFDPFKIQVPATTPTGNPTEWEVIVSGPSTSNSDGGDVLLNHYIRSRRQQTVEDDIDETGTDAALNSYFDQLDSLYMDATDEMISTYSSYGDNRPYQYDPDVVQMRARLDSVITSCSIIAPLGIIKFGRFTAGDKYLVNVDAIIEM